MNRLILCLLATTLALTSGCTFWKKNPAPKENPTIARDTDEGFRQRFMDKRTAELVAQGLAADAAGAQAAVEFKTRYGFTSAAGK